MRTISNALNGSVAMVAIALGALAACGDATSMARPDADGEPSAAAVGAGSGTATDADWTAEDATLGGMGRHLLNAGLIDDEVLVPSPEALIYEPDPNGELRLVGVEYVIPFAILGTDAQPPVLFGQEFKQNFTFDLWALHVWPWKHNPSGMFADWNPSVSCEHDAHVEG